MAKKTISWNYVVYYVSINTFFGSHFGFDVKLQNMEQQAFYSVQIFRYTDFKKTHDDF